MTDLQADKLTGLRDHIVERAHMESHALLETVKKDIATWYSREAEKLDTEVDLLLRDARSRAEEIRRRQIAAAERERVRERLRVQNRLLQDAQGMLEEELASLREREDYDSILLGLLKETLEHLGTGGSFRFRLASADGVHGKALEKAVSGIEGVTVSFDPEPAPISGGIFLVSEDGKVHVLADWHVKAQEMTETLAQRLLPLL
ncbi:V-type ATP synthase subunit E [Aminiphilus circumscriptus]|jgi:V/A-type H+-transporting ATPase subunit E|uniref:V-type ATP synthase subunit E n=1 Tax=Aminiphilus circumscriptus TaxID=290732 RepID=UPI000492D08B|nr:V-type ATP synthase subunit E family protein [Aminiphilus circumscriptus]